MYGVFDINMNLIEGGFQTEQEAEWWIEQNFIEECSIQPCD